MGNEHVVLGPVTQSSPQTAAQKDLEKKFNLMETRLGLLKAGQAGLKLEFQSEGCRERLQVLELRYNMAEATL